MADSGPESLQKNDRRQQAKFDVEISSLNNSFGVDFRLTSKLLRLPGREGEGAAFTA